MRAQDIIDKVFTRLGPVNATSTVNGVRTVDVLQVEATLALGQAITELTDEVAALRIRVTRGGQL